MADPGEDLSGAVTIAVASKDTRWYTELCLRSIAWSVDRPSVRIGDCASTDGSAEMAGRLARRWGWTVEHGPADRTHGAWIDHWRATVESPYLVVLDSDVVCLRQGWLPALLDDLDGVAMLAHDVCQEGSYVETRPEHGLGFSYTLLRRPDPSVLLVALDATRWIDTSFTFQWQRMGERSEDRAAWDTAGAFAAALDSAGLGWRAMNPDIRTAFHHYCGRTWRSDPGRVHRVRLAMSVARKLARVRARDALTGVLAHLGSGRG